MYSGRLGDWHTNLGTQTLAPKKQFSRFLQLYHFNKKYVEEAINDFIMHLFQNGLEDKNPDRREKQGDNKR